MDNLIQSLYKKYDLKKLMSYVQSLNITEVCCEVSSICLKENGSSTIQLLFKSLPNSLAFQEKKDKIFVMVFTNIQENKVPNKLANNLISILADEVNNVSTALLVKMLNNCLQVMLSMQNEEETVWWKTLMPQLLSAIEHKPFVEHNGIKTTGPEFKKQFIITLLMNEWNENKLSNIATMFSEISLKPDEHLKVVNKICKNISKLNLNEIPPLTYQLLLLTKEYNSMPVFLALADLFDNNIYSKINENDNNASQIIIEDNSNFKEILLVERTVLYHINKAASGQCIKSVKDFLKILKECIHYPKFILRPFFLTLLLNLSTISYEFQTKIMNLILPAFLRLIVEQEKIFNSAWLETIISNDVDIDSILSKILYYSCKDKDEVLKGLIYLGFSLLETKGKVKENGNELAWKIGSTLLVNLVQLFPRITCHIFQQLINQITQNYEFPRFTDCLTKIINKRSLNMAECEETIIQLLGNICENFPPIVGQRIFIAVLPIIKMSYSFRDNLIIFLRKALLSDLSSREMGVYGLLELLKEFHINDNFTSLSQCLSQNYVGISQVFSGTKTHISNEGLCLEILSILKQVYNYHSNVKILFYNDIYYSFKDNPKIGAQILDILKIRFDKFYQEIEGCPPLDFQKTVVYEESTIVVKEPVAHLLLAISMVVGKAEQDFVGEIKFTDVLNSICDKMADCDIPHFGLSKDQNDNSHNDPIEFQLKQEMIFQILGVYEALMSFVLCNWEKEFFDPAPKLNALFKGYYRLHDYAKSFGTASKKKVDLKKKEQNKEKEDYNFEKLTDKLKTKTFKFPPTILNLKCIGRLLTLLTGMPVSWAQNKNTDLIKNKKELHRYAYSVTLELLSKNRDMSYSELSRRKYTVHYIFFIGRILFKYCILDLYTIRNFDLQCAALAAECFYELLTFISNCCKSKMSEFFVEIGLVNEKIGCQFKTLLITILDLIANLADDVEEEKAKEEAFKRKLYLSLISICSFSVNKLEKNTAKDQKILNKLILILKEKKIQTPSVAKALFSLFIDFQCKDSSANKFLLHFVLCLCDTMPLIDDEMEIDKHENFAIINPKTSTTCFTVLCEAVHSIVQDVEWALQSCKTENMILNYNLTETSELKINVLQEKEKEICRRLNFSIKILSVLCTIAVSPGHLSDMLLKEVGNLYNKLTLTAKYFMYKFLKHQQTFLHAKFDKTVKITDSELTKNMYCFTEHIINNESSIDEISIIKNRKTNAATVKKKILKDTKIIPKIVYEREQFQKFVLQLSKKTKINLELKNTMARDYRLYSKQVKEIIEKEKDLMENQLTDDNECEPPKRVKIDE